MKQPSLPYIWYGLYLMNETAFFTLYLVWSISNE
jgi:hypothetical protein